MRTKKELAELLSVEKLALPQTSELFPTYSDMQRAANKFVKPQKYSALWNPVLRKLMLCPNERVKDYVKEGPWQLVGKYDSEAYMKKKLIENLPL